MSLSDGQLANAANFNAAFISKTSSSAGPVLEIVSVSNTYTALSTDSVIICDGTSTAFTINLPTAVGIAGKVYHIKRTDTTFANLITIDPFGSETIDGYSTRTFAIREEASIISNGSNWLILNRYIDGTPFVATFTGTWVTNTTYTARCSRRGGSVLFNVGIALTGAPTSATLTLTMPTGMDISNSLFDSGNGVKKIGYGFASDSGVATYPVSVYRVSSTTVTICADVSSATYTTTSDVTQAVPFTFGNGDGIRVMFEVQLNNWNA